MVTYIRGADDIDDFSVILEERARQALLLYIEGSIDGNSNDHTTKRSHAEKSPEPRGEDQAAALGQTRGCDIVEH